MNAEILLDAGMHSIGKSTRKVLAAAFLALMFYPAQAEGLKDDSFADTGTAVPARLEATIVPMYGWVPGINGGVGARGLSTSIDVSPIDVLRNLDDLIEALDGIYIGAGHIRYGKFGFAYDAVYFNLSSVREFSGERSGAINFSRPGVGPFPGRDLTLTAGARVDGIVDVAFSYTMATFAGTYRAYETPTTQVDLVAGARVTDVDVKVGVVVDAAIAAQADLTIGPISKSVGVTAGRQVNASARRNENWVDPIVGVMGRSKLDQNWLVTGWAMMGGFGVNSDFVFDVMGGVGYDLSNGISAFAGYRISHTDYQNAAFQWDLTMHGPVMGVSAKF